MLYVNKIFAKVNQEHVFFLFHDGE